ncbi:hypothetical protein R75483_07877 [Paraburkholderia domus]|nr:hypothetical protein R75483_07877 [Paraburkholderia domus]
MIAFLDVVFQCHPGRLCDRNKARFAELRFPDGKYPADEVNVGPVEPKRFAWPEARRYKKPYERRIGQRSHAGSGSQLSGAGHKQINFLLSVNVRGVAPSSGTQESCWRNLVSIVNHVHPSGKSSHLREAPPPGSAFDEYGRRRPAQSQIGCNELGTFAFQQINEMTECQCRLIE